MTAEADDVQTELIDDFIERAMAHGLTHGQATRLCVELCLKESDRRARKGRSRFTVIK